VKKERRHAYTFSGKFPWMNKKTDTTKRSFEAAVTMVD